MPDSREFQAVLIVSHGSPRPKANEAFVRFVDRVASRLPGTRVRPAFFSLVSPTIEEQIAGLVAEGVRSVRLLPYFLHTGQHITQDIPAQLIECRRKHPLIEIELLPTLQDDPGIEDVLVYRLTESSPDDSLSQMDGPAIEKRSWDIIDRRLGLSDIASGWKPVVRRVIHATADFSFAESLRFHPDALDQGREILRRGGAVICDVNMLKAGLTHLKGNVLCAIRDPGVIERARQEKRTRASVAMDWLAPSLEGALVAIGNAPTALWRLLEIVRSGGPRPGLVVGVPVGFVGASEAKAALMRSDLCFISNTGPSGGSPVASAIVNALADLPSKETR